MGSFSELQRRGPAVHLRLSEDGAAGPESGAGAAAAGGAI